MILAAAYSNLKISWIDGLPGSGVMFEPLKVILPCLANLEGQVDDITLPLRPDQSPPSDAFKGSWRAHMNAIQSCVSPRTFVDLFIL